MPPNFAPPRCKIFFAFSPNFESSYLWIEVTQIAQNWNFYRHFPTKFRYGFEFLIPCLNFELETFKPARFFKNILFYPFLRGYILHRKYYSLIKLAMLLKYIYETVIKQYEGGSCNKFWVIMNQIRPIFWKNRNCAILWALVDNVGNILKIWNFAQSLLTAKTISYVNFKNVSQL